jgi:Tfp pilus assembly protein PilF
VLTVSYLFSFLLLSNQLSAQESNLKNVDKPDNAEAHFNLGIAYLAQSDTGNAREEHKILANLDTALADKLFKLINK